MSRVLERGDVFFLYWPRVEQEEVAGLAFFLLLSPDGSERYRRIVVGRKRLPKPEAHERFWAFVDEVAEKPAEIRDQLRRGEYDTATLGGFAGRCTPELFARWMQLGAFTPLFRTHYAGRFTPGGRSRGRSARRPRPRRGRRSSFATRFSPTRTRPSGATPRLACR